MSVTVISVTIMSATQRPAARIAARQRGSVTFQSTRHGPVAVRASSSSSRSTHSSPWPTSRITHGNPAMACTQMAVAMPCPHGLMPIPVGEMSGSSGPGLVQRATGSKPPVPSAACQAEVNSGKGMNKVRSVRKRNSPRRGKSVR